MAAKIVPSTLAPSEKFTLSFAAGSFDLDGSKKTSAYETDDPTLVADALTHPWVKVEVPDADQFGGEYVKHIDPKDDPLSSAHPNARLAFDPEAHAALAQAEAVEPVAIEAGLDQDKKVESGPVARTIAAAEDNSTDKEKK